MYHVMLMSLPNFWNKFFHLYTFSAILCCYLTSSSPATWNSESSHSEIAARIYVKSCGLKSPWAIC